MKNRKTYLKIFAICIVSFLVCCCNGYSQIYDFEIKYSKKDIDKQRELFKNAKVKFAIIGEGEAEKISFDKDGKILIRESFSTDSEEYEFFKDTYFYNKMGQMIKVNCESGDGDEYNLTYDDNGNVKKFTYMYRSTENYQYDVNNNVSQIDFESVTRSVCPSIILKYDESNRLIERNEPCCDGSIKNTTYSYDENGNVDEIISNYSDCNLKSKSFRKTKFSYNTHGLPTRVVYNSSDGSTKIENIKYEYYK